MKKIFNPLILLLLLLNTSVFASGHLNGIEYFFYSLIAIGVFGILSFFFAYRFYKKDLKIASYLSWTLVVFIRFASESDILNDELFNSPYSLINSDSSFDTMDFIRFLFTLYPLFGLVSVILLLIGGLKHAESSKRFYMLCIFSIFIGGNFLHSILRLILLLIFNDSAFNIIAISNQVIVSSFVAYLTVEYLKRFFKDSTPNAAKNIISQGIKTSFILGFALPCASLIIANLYGRLFGDSYYYVDLHFLIRFVLIPLVLLIIAGFVSAKIAYRKMNSYDSVN
jgi:hypothetical protein